MQKSSKNNIKGSCDPLPQVSLRTVRIMTQGEAGATAKPKRLAWQGDEGFCQTHSKMSECVSIIFIGDIVGQSGRQIVSDYLNNSKDLSELKDKEAAGNPNFIVANVENASHGFGLTLKNHNELVSMGIHAFTSGNHIWDKKEIFSFIDTSDRLIRPLNYPDDVPGVGSKIFSLKDPACGIINIGVINLLGRIFMNPIESPWSALEKEVRRMKEITPIILVDFHAEATAEKISFGYYADKLGVSALVGTHTHVQTSDEKILKKGCAYITDVGFCGASEGVIGMDCESSFKRLSTGLPERFDVAKKGKTELNAVKILINKQTGRAQSIKRIKYLKDYSEVN